MSFLAERLHTFIAPRRATLMTAGSFFFFFFGDEFSLNLFTRFLLKKCTVDATQTALRALGMMPLREILSRRCGGRFGTLKLVLL